MTNVLSEEKRQQVLGLGRLGWSLRRIEKETGVRRETAGQYLKAAGIDVRPPRDWGRRPSKPANEGITDSQGEVGAGIAGEESKPAKEGITDSGVDRTTLKEASRSVCAPFQEFIEEGMRLGRNAVAIYQDLVDRHGYANSYISVRRFTRALRGSESDKEAHPVIETLPGEEAQVDYGEGPMVRNPETGKYQRTRLFVLTLGCSRKSVRLLTFKSSSKKWAQFHEESFRRLGGATRTVVLDNLKEGVLKPDVYEPALNPLFRDVLAHYGVVALPCRVRHPDRKGKVESGVGHAQKTPLRGMRFETLEEAQTYLDRWEEKWADTRIHGTTKRQVAVMFAEEKPHLLPLPVEPFRYYAFGVRTVHLDGHVEVEAAYYSVPHGFIGKQVSVQWDELHVRILDGTGALLREHFRQVRGRHRTREEDKPKSSPRGTQDLLSRAQNAGKNIGALCADIYRREKEIGVRRILGVLSMARKFGAPATDDACAAALEVGVPTYRFVRHYLERRLAPAVSLKQVDPLIRQLTHYRDLINRRTQQGEVP